MKNYEREQPPVTPDVLLLRPGIGAYPVNETLIGLTRSRREETPDDESVGVELQELSELAHQARLIIEAQGGVFNGLVEREVHRTDQEWMGATVAIRVTYALAYKPE